MRRPTKLRDDKRKYIGIKPPSQTGFVGKQASVMCVGGFFMEEYEDMPWRKVWDRAAFSRDINAMPDDFTRLFWIMLPLALSRDGTTLADFSYLKGKLFPLRRDVTDIMISDALEWCVNRGMVLRYEVDGESYIYQVSFREDQGPRGREAPSPFPPPPDIKSSTDSRVEENTIEVEQNRKRIYVEESDINIHPAVLIYKDILGKEVGDKLLPNQAKAIAGRVRGLDYWRETIDAWSMRGYRPTDVNGMLEWYESGIPDSKKELIEDGRW